MASDFSAFSLFAKGWADPQPVLTGVHAHGHLDGVLFDLTLRQTFRNGGSLPLEVIYTFTLPPNAVLLGFAAELQGERLEARVLAKGCAEDQYEDALASRDLPIMLERLSMGVHTVSIGNLCAGEEVVLELRMAQVLVIEQGRIRLAIPMTIAPRYGNAEQAGLQPHQVPQSSVTVDYPLTLSVVASGPWSGAVVDCPTHRFKLTRLEGGVQLDFAERAWLDRDVVITATPAESPPSLLITSHDERSAPAPTVAMALLQPRKARQRPRVLLKVLVDCSNSMAGDGIICARRALRGLVGGLQEGDAISLSCFGTSIEHLATLPACPPHALSELLVSIDRIEADRGETQLMWALNTLQALLVAPEHPAADVILISGGAIWQADELVAQAQANGHRIFAIGVGSAPAEGLLRALAEATGGACEFATVGESLEAAAIRTLGRIRQEVWSDVRIDWGCQPAWQAASSRHAFAGDTLIAYAGLGAGSNDVVARLMAKDEDGSSVELARSEAVASCPGDALARLAAERRLMAVPTSERLAIAVDYRLMSGDTYSVLKHRREGMEEILDEALMHQVSSMAAAGWGSMCGERERDGIRQSQRCASRKPLGISFGSLGDIESSRSSREESRSSTSVPHSNGISESTAYVTLRSLKDAILGHLSSWDPWQPFAIRLANAGLHRAVLQAIDQIQGIGLSPQQAWFLLAYWVQCQKWERPGQRVHRNESPREMGIDFERVDQVFELLSRFLPGCDIDARIGGSPVRVGP